MSNKLTDLYSSKKSTYSLRNRCLLCQTDKYTCCFQWSGHRFRQGRNPGCMAAPFEVINKITFTFALSKDIWYVYVYDWNAWSSICALREIDLNGDDVLCEIAQVLFGYGRSRETYERCETCGKCARMRSSEVFPI